MVFVVALLGLAGLFALVFALWLVVWALTMSGAGYPEEDAAYVRISDR